MPIDPAAGFPTTPEDRILARLAEFERRLGANPGAQADYGEVLGTASSSLDSAFEDKGGPYAEVLVPEGGAFVTLYFELEGRMTAGASAGAQVTIYEATDLPAGPVMARFAGAGFALRRLGTGADGQDSSAPGVFRVYRATPGLRTYSLRYGMAGPGSGEFRNRRLWGRVAY